MNEDPMLCRERADLERRAAASTNLACVQERHLQSAATWERMAARSEAVQQLRANRSPFPK